MNTLKSGAIVLSHDDPSKVLVLYRKRENDWTFPKGHVDPGELADETAPREVLEETGLHVRRLEEEELPKLEYDYPEGGHVEVRMYLMQSTDDALLKPEFEGDQSVWLSLEEVPQRLSYDNTKRHFAECLPRINKAVERLRVAK